MKNDKQWLKEKRASWKEFEFNIKEMGIWDKEVFKIAKEYYLTGDEDSKEKLREVPFGLILEIWLHAEKDVDALRDEYAEVTRHGERGLKECFTEYRRYLPSRLQIFKGESCFNGRELILYKVLFDDSCERGKHPYFSDEKFDAYLGKQFKMFCYMISIFVNQEDLNQFEPAQLMVNDFSKLLHTHYVQYSHFDRIAEWLFSNNEIKEPLKIKMKDQLSELFELDSLPNIVKERVEYFRDKAQS